MRPLIQLLFLLLFALLAPCAAAEAPPRPAVEDIRTRLETLADRKLSEADQRAAQQALEQAVASLGSADDYRQRLATLKETLATAPARIAEARSQVAALQRDSGKDAHVTAPPSAELEQRLAEQEGALSDWRKRLDEADSLLVGARTGPERAQTEISSGQQRMTAIEAAIAAGREAGRDARALSAERRDALAA
ncbi:MAG: mechanosensitive channel MscK, partial [Thauera sp.]